MLNFLHQIDNQIILALNNPSTPFWDSFMWMVSTKETWYILYASILFVLWKNFSLKTTLIIFLAIVLTLVFTDQVSASIIRPYAERMRPSNPENPISKYIYTVNGYRGGSYGLPSCHSANTFGLAFITFLILRSKILTGGLLAWACLNSYSRMYLGVHYMGDIICGMMVAIIGAVMINYSVKYIMRFERVKALAGTTERDTQLIRSHQSLSVTTIPVGVMLLTLTAIAIYSVFMR